MQPLPDFLWVWTPEVPPCLKLPRCLQSFWSPGVKSAPTPSRLSCSGMSCESTALWDPEIWHFFPQFLAQAQPGSHSLRISQTKGLYLSQQLRPFLSSYKDFLEVASTHGPQQGKPSAWCFTICGFCASSWDQRLGTTSHTFTWMLKSPQDSNHESHFLKLNSFK